MARIAITGGTGFVGRHTAGALLDAGHEVRMVARGTRKPPRLEGVEVVRGDVAGGRGLGETLDGCDAVVNLVAIIRERGSQTFERVNAEGARQVAETAHAAGARHLVHISALGADPDPRYAYLWSKWQGEQHVRASGIPFTILRPSLVFGPGDGFFVQLARMVRLPAPIPVAGDGRTVFQPIAIGDLTRIIVRCVEGGLAGDPAVIDRVFEVGGPAELSYDAIIDIIKGQLGVGFPRVKVHIPMRAMVPIATVMNAVLPNAPVTPAQLRMLEKNNVTTPAAVRTAFGFEPLSFKENCEYLREL